MTERENNQQQNAPTNDSADEIELNDLMLSEAWENDIKAGIEGSDDAYARVFQLTSHQNHNETTVSDKEGEDKDSMPLADLEPQDEVKGGCGTFHKENTLEQPVGGGGFINNHNETVESDEDSDQNAIADLEVLNAEEVKGGAGGDIEGELTTLPIPHNYYAAKAR